MFPKFFIVKYDGNELISLLEYCEKFDSLIKKVFEGLNFSFLSNAVT